MEVGARVECFVGTVDGAPVWANSTILAFNEANDTYELEIDDFGIASDVPHAALRKHVGIPGRPTFARRSSWKNPMDDKPELKQQVVMLTFATAVVMQLLLILSIVYIFIHMILRAIN